MKIYIYGIVNLRNGRIDWVGQTTNPVARYSGMRSPGGKFRRHRIAIVLLATASNRTKANLLEEAYFDRYRAQGGCRKMFRRFRPYPDWRIEREAKK